MLRISRPRAHPNTHAAEQQADSQLSLPLRPPANNTSRRRDTTRYDPRAPLRSGLRAHDSAECYGTVDHSHLNGCTNMIR
eukprot:722376-Prymnesium_polylepis.1